MFGLGMGELIVVGVIALIFIGPKKLPELAKGLGQGIKEFQKAAKGFSDQLQNADQPTQPKTPEEKPDLGPLSGQEGPTYITNASQQPSPTDAVPEPIKKDEKPS